MPKIGKSNKNTKYILNKGFITQKIGNKTTIFAGEESILFTLNETAAYIFNGIKLNWDYEKIVKGLIEKYNAPREQAEKDILVLIEELAVKKIIIPR